MIRLITIPSMNVNYLPYRFTFHQMIRLITADGVNEIIEGFKIYISSND